MAMTRGTALVLTVARVVALTGQQDIGNLQKSSPELTLTDLLVSASDIVFDRLEGDGIDPTTLTNQTAYEQAVAWEFLSILAEARYLTQEPTLEDNLTRFRARAERHYKAVRPKTSGDDPRRAGESVPAVGNFERGWAFADGGDNQQDVFTEWLPDSRD